MRVPAQMIMQKQTDFDAAVSGDLNIRVHGPGQRSWPGANTHLI